MSQAQDDLIGKSLGQFEIIEEIGRGGMATVYRARQTSIKRIVAIKVLPRTLLHDPSFYERFTREVDLVAHLEHPHILPIYDYGEVDGTPYIAMRYLAGGSMAQWLRRGLPPLNALPKPVTQVSAALDYAHQQGVIHRDLKPGNVLMDENGNAYLSDFGIARVLNSNLTGSAIIGTPAYMSPEQANGLPLDARSDIYSLGVMLFELITGHSPFEAETPVALLLKHINEPIPSLRALRPELPVEAERVVIKATSKHPDGRYPSAGDLAEAFAAALQGSAPATKTGFDDDPSQATIFDPESMLKRTPPPIDLDNLITPPPQHRPVDMYGAAQQATPPPAARTGTGGSAATAASPTEAITPPPPAKKGGISPALIIGLVAVVALVIVGVMVLPRLNAPPAPTPAPMPTPFTNAYTAQRSQYTMSVPEGWSLSSSSAEAGKEVWQLNDDAYVAVRMVNKSAPDANFAIEAQALDATEMRSNDSLRFIDGATAEDGSIRRSYVVLPPDGSDDDPQEEDTSDDFDVPPGQLDVFYLDRGAQVAVVEVYSSYDTANDLVSTFQQVLDSLRITST